MSYRFVRYQPKYREEVVHLQTALWSPDLARNSAYLAWKYEQNPYIDEPLIYLAMHNDHVVGMRGYCGLQWELGDTGQGVIMPCAGDSTIAAEHRQRSLLRQLLQFSDTDKALTAFPYTLGLSAGAPLYFCALSEGWRVIGAYGTLARTTSLHKLFKSERLKTWARPWQRHPALAKLSKMAAHLRRPFPSRGHIQIS